MNNDLELCTQEQTEQRLQICMTCPSFEIQEDRTTSCKECDCHIAYLISHVIKVCPKGFWQ